MKLFHKDDVAIELLDNRDSLEKAFIVDTDFYIPSSARGLVKLINENELDINVGDIVYFDPRHVCEIKELNLLVMDQKNILIKE